MMLQRDKTRKVPLRALLIVPFAMQLVAMVALVGWLSLRDGQSSVAAVTDQLRHEIDRRIHEYLRALLEIPHRVNRANADALALGELDLGAPESLGGHFWRQIRLFDSASFVFFASVEGGAAGAGRFGDALRVDVTDVDPVRGLVAGTRYDYAVDDQGQRGEVLESTPGFDARERPWFAPAMASSGPVWSDVYWFFVDNSPAIGANLRVDGDDGAALGVLGVDLSLAQVSAYLRSLELGAGTTFIVERDGLLVASSAPEPALSIVDAGGPRRRFARESPTPQVAGVTAAVAEQFGGWSAIDRARRTTVDLAENLEGDLAGDPYFVTISPLTDPRGIDWLIVTVLPRADYLAGIDASRRRTVALILGALVFAGLLGLLTARWIAQPIKRLNVAAKAVAAGDFGQHVSAPPVGELNGLARSFNKMSRQLAASFEQLESKVASRTEALRLAKEQAENASRAKTDFLANVSHEVRTPLAAMLGYVSLLRDRDDVPDDVLGDLRTVQSHGSHLEQLLSDLIDISRVEAGQMILDVRPARLARILADLASAHVPQARIKNLELSIHAEGWLPWRFDVDRLRLRQVLGNLLSNAVKYTERGRVDVTVSCHPAPADRQAAMPTETRLRLSVADTGVGIAEADRERLFKRFTRLEGDAPPQRGFGLGLAITRQLVDLMGGSIAVESQLGQGSRFVVELPVSACDDWDDQPRGSERSARSVLPTRLPRLAGKVLVAEDAPDLRRLCQRMLERWGLDCDVVTDGAEAVSRVAKGQYDAIIMDWQMPVMDGLEAARRIRRQGFDAPILALTAAAMAGDREACLAAGCTDYLGKPIDFRELHRVLLGWLPPKAPQVAPSDDDDMELLALERTFLDRLPTLLGTLLGALDAGDWQQLERETHRLVGTAGSFGGLDGVAEAAARLEDAVRARVRATATIALDNLATAVQRAVALRRQERLTNG